MWDTALPSKGHLSETGAWSLIGDLRWRQLVLLGTLWLGGAVLASTFIMHETNEMFDNAMTEAANAVLMLSEDSGDAAKDTSRLERLAFSGDRRKYMSFQIRDAAGRVVRRSSAAPTEAYPVPLEVGFVGRGAMRYLTRRMSSGDGFVQIAEFYDERRDAFLGLLAGFLLPLLAMIAAGGYVLSRGAARVGKPIAQLGRQLQARSGANLALIDPVGVPVELEPIIVDINRLLSRLSEAFEAERAFSANCAHELRNPIASARAQIEYMAMFPDDETNPARIGSVGRSLSELGHRIERLLQLSRAEAGVSVSTQSSDLIGVTKLLVDDYVRRGKVVAFDAGSRTDLPVAIDKDAVGIAVQNLIDNALFHADAAAEVDVSIDGNGALHVVNGCDAIPPDELARLRQRYQRDRDARLGGYGLGLAIVGELMRQVGGHLELRSPATGRVDGFEAIMALPAVTSGNAAR